MSEAMDLSTEVCTIYVPLRNEGTVVFRPTTGIKVGRNFYEILSTKDYDPTTEEWEFPPGSVVECTQEMKNGQEVLMAKTSRVFHGTERA